MDRSEHRWRIQIRRDRPVKPSCEMLDGRVFALRPMWLMGEDDPYPGELALGPASKEADDAFEAAGIAWVASGDATPEAPQK